MIISLKRKQQNPFQIVRRKTLTQMLKRGWYLLSIEKRSTLEEEIKRLEHLKIELAPLATSE